MQGDTAKREGREAFLLPPITPKIVQRAEELQEPGGRNRCCWRAPPARRRQAAYRQRTGSCLPQRSTALRGRRLGAAWDILARERRVGKSCSGKQLCPGLAWGSEIRPFFFRKGVILADSMGVIPVTNERLRKEGTGLTCILNLNTDI